MKRSWKLPTHLWTFSVKSSHLLRPLSRLLPPPELLHWPSVLSRLHYICSCLLNLPNRLSVNYSRSYFCSCNNNCIKKYFIHLKKKSLFIFFNRPNINIQQNPFMTNTSNQSCLRQVFTDIRFDILSKLIFPAWCEQNNVLSLHSSTWGSYANFRSSLKFLYRGNLCPLFHHWKFLILCHLI